VPATTEQTGVLLNAVVRRSGYGAPAGPRGSATPPATANQIAKATNSTRRVQPEMAAALDATVRKRRGSNATSSTDCSGSPSPGTQHRHPGSSRSRPATPDRSKRWPSPKPARRRPVGQARRGSSRQPRIRCRGGSPRRSNAHSATADTNAKPGSTVCGSVRLQGRWRSCCRVEGVFVGPGGPVVSTCCSWLVLADGGWVRPRGVVLLGRSWPSVSRRSPMASGWAGAGRAVGRSGRVGRAR